jgi:hypothetical protein
MGGGRKRGKKSSESRPTIECRKIILKLINYDEFVLIDTARLKNGELTA